VTIIRKHPLLAYYVLTFAISWGGFLVAVGPASLGSSNWQAEGKFAAAVIVMLAGPAVSGLLFTGLLDGRAGYRTLFRRLCAWRVGLRWYLFALLPAPIVTAAVLLALSLPFPIATSDDNAALFFAGLSAGITTVFEEIGWTGFAVPRLRRIQSVPKTGLIVGVLWGVWHFLQQLFISGTYAGGIEPTLFLVLAFSAAIASLTAYRLLLVWLYDRTGSLLVTTLMHAQLTATTIFWLSPFTTGVTFLANVWLVAAGMWLIVGAIAVFDGWFTRGHTDPFRGADGRVMANSVADDATVSA
jgi:uncharacterized protein